MITFHCSMLNMASFRLTLIMLIIAFGMVKGRRLELEPYSTASMISDGIDHENVLRMDASNSSVSTTTLSGDKRCQTSFDFLPCADTKAEMLFLVCVYTYCMMLGESWIRKGSQALFLLLGDYKVIGASFFRVLMAFPRIVLVIVAGLGSSEAAAQNQVDFGVRMYAGSTLVTLTYMWGFYIASSSGKLRGKEPMTIDEHREDSSTKCLPLKQILSFLNDYGVDIDKETRHMAMIMLFSLIPFLAVYLVAEINTSLTTILFALIVSITSLVAYVVYQIWNPWIQFRSLAYLKEENLRIRFLHYLPRLVEEGLVDEHGNPNYETINSAFRLAMDKQGYISHEELETWIENVLNLEEDDISKDYAKAEILTHFDDDHKSRKINLCEFQKGITKWLKKWKKDAFNSDSESRDRWKHVLKVASRNKGKSLAEIDQIMTRILKQVLKKENIVKENGDPDKAKIEELISQHDLNRDNKIQREECQTFIESLNFGVPLDNDTIFDKLEEDFDKNNNHETIDKNLFVDGFIKWIHKAMENDPSIKNPRRAIANYEEDCRAEIDPPINYKVKPMTHILYVIYGIVMVSVFSRAFMQSVIQFLDVTGIPFNITSLVILPSIMCIKKAVPPILFAQKNASLRLSELYSGLVMNNLLGLFLLLVTVYMKGLSWTYTNEVLIIMIPCAVVGSFGLTRDTYPLWSSISAVVVYFTYISLLIVSES